ncbi:hypothetical protein BHM03_00034742 [Ensete ventricosum]|nr:hypothetical protein BHM03_00034742 [Ensete ventricosum]
MVRDKDGRDCDVSATCYARDPNDCFRAAIGSRHVNGIWAGPLSFPGSSAVNGGHLGLPHIDEAFVKDLSASPEKDKPEARSRADPTDLSQAPYLRSRPKSTTLRTRVEPSRADSSTIAQSPQIFLTLKGRHDVARAPVK